jgi:hypothetical protein
LDCVVVAGAGDLVADRVVGSGRKVGGNRTASTRATHRYEGLAVRIRGVAVAARDVEPEARRL